MSEATVVPTIHLSENAAQKLTEVIDNHPNPVAGLRLEISGRQEGAFQHLLSLVEEGAQVEGDQTADASGLTFFFSERDAAYLDGVQIDFTEPEPGQGALSFSNPNPIWSDPREWAIQELFDQHVNPQIASHGGVITLLGVQERTAYVEFGGGCVGCGMLNVTLKQGVEVAVKESVEDIDEIVDITDHASGTNPYYKPSKK